MVGAVTGNVDECQGGLPDIYNFIGNKKVFIQYNSYIQKDFGLSPTLREGLKSFIILFSSNVLRSIKANVSNKIFYVFQILTWI